MLIPFGMKQGKLYDVTEVERGRACGCVCPSCGQNLVARKGESGKRDHYFAHDAKACQDKDGRIECEFSFCVAARLVIKQCFRELNQFSILLPEWLLTLDARDKFDRKHTVSAYVAKSQTKSIHQFDIEPAPPFHELDIVGEIEGHLIGFHFSYSGRPAMIEHVKNDISIVDIDLEPLKSLIDYNQQNQSEPFKSRIVDYVLNGEHRQWLTHKRYCAAKQSLQERLAEKIAESELSPPSPSTSPNQRQRAPNGPCVICNQNAADYIEQLICGPCLQSYYQKGVFHGGQIKKAVIDEFLS